jgi:general L-amino acid transport system substrate-binding protein
MRFFSVLFVSAVFVAGLAFEAGADTLSDVKARGVLKCGVSQGLPGFSNPDEAGGWTGIDVDFCRAVAAAVLGDANKVKYSSLSAKERLTAIQSGEIDLLSRNTTWTLIRDTALGLNFAGVIYYDGQGFMVRKDLGVKSALELNGASVCINLGTTTELNLSDYFRTHNMEFEPVVFERSDEVVAAYDAGRCDVYTTDRSGLAAQRLALKDSDAHMILPEIISKEPLGPVVRQGDERWLDISRWILFALFEAEELGVTSENAAKIKNSENPSIRRLLGTEGKMGQKLGLDNDWALRVIVALGNYGEVFERNLGSKTPLKLERGLNKLWTDGGLHYAMPLR